MPPGTFQECRDLRRVGTRPRGPSDGRAPRVKAGQPLSLITVVTGAPPASLSRTLLSLHGQTCPADLRPSRSRELDSLLHGSASRKVRPPLPPPRRCSPTSAGPRDAAPRGHGRPRSAVALLETSGTRCRGRAASGVLTPRGVTSVARWRSAPTSCAMARSSFPSMTRSSTRARAACLRGSSDSDAGEVLPRPVPSTCRIVFLQASVGSVPATRRNVDVELLLIDKGSSAPRPLGEVLLSTDRPSARWPTTWSGFQLLPAARPATRRDRAWREDSGSPLDPYDPECLSGFRSTPWTAGRF